MLRHVPSQHLMSKQWVCEECSQVFSSKSNLNRHQKRCKGEQPSPSTSSSTSNKKPKVDKPANHHVICAISHRGFTIFRKSQSSHVASLLQHLKDKDILEHVHQQRPDTKWRLTHITNVLYRKIRKGIPFNDNLCMFRALMYYIN